MAKFGWFNQPTEQLNPVYEAADLERRAKQQRKFGSAEAAVQLYRNALSIRESELPGTEYMTLQELGKTLTMLNRTDEAVECFRRASEIIQRDYYAEHPSLIPILDAWAYCALKSGDLSSAETICKRSLEIKNKANLLQDVHVLETMRTLAEIERRLERYSEAEKLLKSALKVVDAATIAPIEEFLFELALVYQDQSRYAEAEENFREALRIFAHRGGKIARYATCLKSYATLLRNVNRGMEANRLDEEAQTMLDKFEALQPGGYGQNKPGMVFFDDELYACTIVH